MTMTNRDKLFTYFQKFSDKDLEALAEMFAEDVLLTDWDISESGKDDVVAANKRIFDSVESIVVKPLSVYSDGDNSFAVEILILVNDKEILEVVDVICFNEEGLINSIKAYKR